MKRIRFKHLFHGTSSIYRSAIETNGLLPINGLLHLTTHPSVAWDEADYTINGEDPRHGYKTPVGGEILIVKIDRSAARNLRLDIPGYFDGGSMKIRRLVPKRFAFSTKAPIGPEYLSFIDRDFNAEFEKLMDQIHLMARLLPFQYSPTDEQAILTRRQSTPASFEPK